MSESEIANVPSEQEPAASPAKKADKSVLAKGCAIGCGVLLVLGIFGGIGGYFLVSSIMGKVADAMSKKLAEDFTVMKESGEVPSGDVELYQKLVDISQHEQTTFPAVVLTMAVVKSNLEDGKVDDSERQEAEDTLNFLKEHPDAGMFAVDAFMKKHEGLKERAEKVQRSINPSTLFAPK